MTLTYDTITALFNKNSPNSRQMLTLGIKLRKGWMKRLVGLEISDALYAELLDCKGRRPRGFPKKEWRKKCVPAE